MGQAPLPNFFVVGAGKAGTTSLHGYLHQHPQIYMSPVKEPCYFSSEIRGAHLSAEFESHVRRQSRLLAGTVKDGAPGKPLGWIAQDWDEYLRLFRDAREERAIGEASAAYLWSATAAANIQATIPAAKIVMILRDPAERAFSQYLHQASVGLTGASFREHLTRCVQALEGAPGDATQLSIFHPFLEAGLYSAQVQRFLDRFPREQVRIYWYEDAWRDMPAMLEDLFKFLGVDSSFRPDTSQKSLERRRPRWLGAHRLLKKFRLWYPLRALVPDAMIPRLRSAAFEQGKALKMDARDREFLVDYYREDVLKLSAMLDRDLSGWLR